MRKWRYRVSACYLGCFARSSKEGWPHSSVPNPAGRVHNKHRSGTELGPKSANLRLAIGMKLGKLYLGYF